MAQFSSVSSLHAKIRAVAYTLMGFGLPKKENKCVTFCYYFFGLDHQTKHETAADTIAQKASHTGHASLDAFSSGRCSSR